MRGSRKGERGRSAVGWISAWRLLGGDAGIAAIQLEQVGLGIRAAAIIWLAGEAGSRH